jgi:hypothetical protein
MDFEQRPLPPIESFNEESVPKKMIDIVGGLANSFGITEMNQEIYDAIMEDCELQNSFSSHFSTQHKTPQFSVIYQKSVSFQTIIVS